MKKQNEGIAVNIMKNAVNSGSLCVGVIAGTQTDTRFGLDYLESRDTRGIGLSISANPQAQTQLQALDRKNLTELVLASLEELVKEGASSAMLYCNSLSGAIDLEQVNKEGAIPVITPLDVYEELTFQYRNFGLLAANCQSCANIERTILKYNRTAKVIGIGNLQIVEDIEAELPPELIIRLHALEDLTRALVKSGVQILILGCTHFDYFYPKLKELTKGIKLFLPSERMLEMLKERSK
ncbi:aspartate/glutamate racemase family protein [Pleionea sp. CnH1-48]|uniref:aspartate/glutamate racemase family protein n=1 Tax=Pleionea sp. CnH1-48 TaxID=2954494 RepID=UPI0020969D8B|nr:aspartate/glutamate racemase family protein [Pleionea sp. CnH1-48]MCO7224971.1 aspartate/glutamate racemase family protein [Pleionea sp. CnH1-48]